MTEGRVTPEQGGPRPVVPIVVSGKVVAAPDEGMREYGEAAHLPNDSASLPSKLHLIAMAPVAVRGACR
jgi:hypothetical protein